MAAEGRGRRGRAGVVAAAVTEEEPTAAAPRAAPAYGVVAVSRMGRGRKGRPPVAFFLFSLKIFLQAGGSTAYENDFCRCRWAFASLYVHALLSPAWKNYFCPPRKMFFLVMNGFPTYFLRKKNPNLNRGGYIPFPPRLAFIEQREVRANHDRSVADPKKIAVGSEQTR